MNVIETEKEKIVNIERPLPFSQLQKAEALGWKLISVASEDDKTCTYKFIKEK